MDQFSQEHSLGTPGYETPSRPGRRSRSYVFSVLALGVLLGFTLGLISFRAPWSSLSKPAVLYDQDLVTSLYEDASPAVVEINLAIRGGLSSPFGAQSSGSGFLVDREGHIVTNDHVVSAAGDIAVTLYDGRTLTATKLGSSPADDLALLQVDPDEVAGITPLELAESGTVQPGQMALAIGSPFRQSNSVSVGVVSGVGRTRVSRLRRPIPNLVQTDAALNPGNSGGPLLNSEGEVIGVNTAVQISSGVGFAVPSDTVRGILLDLATPGELKRPWLGVSGAAVTKEIQIALDLPVDRGIYVTHVCEDSPAEAAKLRADPRRRPSGAGDVIVGVDGTSVSSVSDMVSYFNTLRPGALVTLSVLRDKRTRDVDVTLGEWTNC